MYMAGMRHKDALESRTPMYFKLIGCKILEREIASVTHHCKNVIDVTMMRAKLHDNPDHLHQVLQEEISMIDDNQHQYSNDILNHDYDAILLAYGLCSNAICGLVSHKYPLVIPRAHDCITLVMGDKDAYFNYHMKNPGTFYYWPGIMELGGFDDQESYSRRFQMYLNRYKGNEKRAKRAMDIEAAYTSNYNNLAYINWEALRFPEYEEQAESIAQKKGWTYSTLHGNSSLLKQLVDGDWPEDRFQIIQAGHQARPSYDNQIIEEC